VKISNIVNMTKLKWEGNSEQKAFEKCWAHSPLRAVLHCHSPGVATVTRRHCRMPPAHRCPRQRRNDNNDNDNAVVPMQSLKEILCVYKCKFIFLVQQQL